MRLYETLITPVMIYASEVITMTKKERPENSREKSDTSNWERRKEFRMRKNQEIL